MKWDRDNSGVCPLYTSGDWAIEPSGEIAPYWVLWCHGNLIFEGTFRECKEHAERSQIKEPSTDG